MFIMVVNAAINYSSHVYMCCYKFTIDWVKLNIKIPNFLTIKKKHDGMQFSISGFVDALKTCAFDGIKYEKVVR